MNEIPIPIACGTIGTIIGAISGGCSHTCPVILGASLGLGVGSAISIAARFGLLDLPVPGLTPQTSPCPSPHPEQTMPNPLLAGSVNGSPKGSQENLTKLCDG